MNKDWLAKKSSWRSFPCGIHKPAKLSPPWLLARDKRSSRYAILLDRFPLGWSTEGTRFGEKQTTAHSEGTSKYVTRQSHMSNQHTELTVRKKHRSEGVARHR